MVALDFHASDFAAPSGVARYGAPLLRALVVVLGATIVVLGGLSIRDASGWSAAADGLWRFSAIAFAVALVWEPAASLLPGELRESAECWIAPVTAFFALGFAAYLAFAFAPDWIDRAAPAIGMRVFGTLAAAAVLVLAASSLSRWPGGAGEMLRRASQFAALSFFWISFVLCGIDHLYGPHRPDRFFGISILVLVAALLVRFTAALVRTVKATLAHSAQRRALRAIATV